MSRGIQSIVNHLWRSLQFPHPTATDLTRIVAERQSTMRDVADLAGVTPGTVSRVLNPRTRGLVKATTARRVEAAARSLGYEPNRVARSLRTRRSHTVGVVVPDLTNPLFPPIVRGIDDALAGAGYTALITNTDGVPERARTMVEALRARQVDGFILATALQHDPVVVDAVDDGVPLVLVNRTCDYEGVFAVVPDDRRGVEQAVEHLVGLGHRSIAHVGGPQTMSTGLLRHRGFVEAAAARGIPVPDRAIAFASGYSDDAGRRTARDLLRAWPECTAIVAANDLIALGVYRAAAELGLTCPDDLSVVGFNDMPFADWFHPPLTTIRFPVYDIGARAGELLLARLEDATTAPRTTVLPTSLVVRGSTAPPRG
jgi:LacI family transcriptional regulator